jgi:hypothetical protein
MKMTVSRSAKRTSGSSFEATKIRLIRRMTELVLGQAKFTVSRLKLLTNCPKFEDLKLLPYQIQSLVSAETVQVFVSVLGGTDPALTTENMNDSRLLCEEFGFAALRDKVSTFQEHISVIDEEAHRHAGGVEEQNMQQDWSLGFLQREVAELQTACLDLRKSNLDRKQENMARQDASSRLSEECQALREELAAARERQTKSDRGREQEILDIHWQQDGVWAELARFAEQLAKIWQEQAKSNNAREAASRDIREGVTNQERAHEALKRQLTEAKSAWAGEALGLRGRKKSLRRSWRRCARSTLSPVKPTPRT